MQKCGAIYDKAHLDEVRAQLLNEDSEFAKQLAILIDKHSQPDNRFKLINTFEVMVREGYAHATRLDTFRAEHQGEENPEFYFYNDAITDENYAKKATTKLTPGRKFLVKMFAITERVTSDDCMKKLRQEKGVLVGAQGASLAYEQGKGQLIKGKWHISFDKKDVLWQDSRGRHRVPYVSAHSDGDFMFVLGTFEDDWHGYNVLLCFCDQESLDA